MSTLELRGVTKVYAGRHEALSVVDLDVAEGEFLVVLGPSGSGKSTLLRVIGGLEAFDAGTLVLDGRRAEGWPPYQRDVAMVFQSPALYPHLTAFDNMAFGLRARRVPEREVGLRVRSMAAEFGVERLLSRRPGQMSGGERQRVALGRALVRRAGLVLLDEPLSHLDAPLRAEARSKLAGVRQGQGGTMFMVTHDQAEALALADRIAVLVDGRIVQVGTPEEVYRRPTNRFVATFLGTPPMNLLPCALRVAADTVVISVTGANGPAQVEVPRSAAWLQPLLDRGPGPIELGIRAEQILVRLEPSPGVRPDLLSLSASIAQREPLGHETLALLRVGKSVSLRVRLPGWGRARENSEVGVEIDPRAAIWFDPATGAVVS